MVTHQEGKRARYGRGCPCASVHMLRARVGVVETSLQSHLIRAGFTAELLATFTSQLISSRALTKPLNSTAARLPRSDSKPSAGCTASRGAEANLPGRGERRPHWGNTFVCAVAEQANHQRDGEGIVSKAAASAFLRMEVQSLKQTRRLVARALSCACATAVHSRFNIAIGCRHAIEVFKHVPILICKNQPPRSHD
jgi:hypothetical protein